MSRRVGLIGAGPISDWHVRALRRADLAVTAVAARPGSVRAREFASRHGIEKVFDGWRALLAERDLWDALVLAVPAGATPEVLLEAMKAEVPVLVEKPVALGSQRLSELCKAAHDRVLVGYNRRFYRTVQRAREEVQSAGPLIARIALPEKLSSGGEGKDLLPFFQNSAHGTDMLRFVFGEVEVASVSRLSDGGRLLGIAGLLKSRRNDVIQFEGNWGAPANFALTLYRPGRSFELRPFERATIYDGMEVIPPSDEYPVKRYVPRAVEQVELDRIDMEEKPGFVAQARVLAALMEGGPMPPEAATLEDARRAIELCEALAGTSCG